MERLTYERNDGIRTKYVSPARRELLIQRLAEYENTGLEPEEIERLNDFEKSQVGIMLKKLNEEQRKHRWIPVEKKMPEVGEYVLGTNEYGEVLIYYYAWNSPHTKKMFFHLCGAAATITAWMPLPEPYRTEESGD